VNRSVVVSLGLCLVLLGPRAAWSSETESLVQRGFVALGSWRVDEARQLAAQAFRIDPHDAAVIALMANIKFHLSDYAGAMESFERAKAAGAPEFLLRDMAFAKSALEATRGFQELYGDHFIVRFSPGKDEILATWALETAEAARERIGELLGWRPASRVVIEIYPGASTLAQVSSLTRDEIKNSGTIALCKWNRLMITSPRAVLFGYEWRDTLSHELTHLIIGGASKNSVPIWLHEGIAKFAETAWRDRAGLGLSIQAQKSLEAAAKADRLIPFEKMHPSMAKLKTQEETALAFAEVFTFIEYMVDQKGWPAVRTILTKLSEDKDEDEAVLAAFGVDLETLSGRWIASLKTRKVKREGVAASEHEKVVKDRDDAPDDGLHGLSKKARRYARAADLLYARGRLPAAKEELEKAYAETKSAVISARLAKVALEVGDFASAEKAARTALEASPDLAGPNVTLAEILVRQKKLSEAKLMLDRAIAMNPFDPRIHHLRYAIFSEEKNEPALEEAQRVVRLLMGDSGSRSSNNLGVGGLLEVDAAPFHRVYLRRDGRVLATGLTTPTGPFSVASGAAELLLLPPKGPPSTLNVTIDLVAPGGKAQRIVPREEGS
jgi:tetratricopeptide (TPR) repeat protein